MNREMKLLKSTAILSIGTFLPKISVFFMLPILTGCLSKNDYGIYDLIGCLVSLLLPATTMKVEAAAFRFLVDNKDNKEYVDTITTNIYAFIIPVAIVTLTVLLFILKNLDINVRLLIFFYLFSDSLVNGAREIARGLSKVFIYSISAIVSALCKLFFTALFVLKFDKGLAGAVAALGLSSFVSLTYIFVALKLYQYIDISKINIKKTKELLKYSYPLVPNELSMWVMRVSDRLVVSYFLGVAANAAYSVANKMPNMLSLAQNTFTLAWQENASIASKDKDAPQYYSSMFKTMFNMMAGFFGVLLAFTPILFNILVKGDYDDAYRQIPILFVAVFFNCMAAFLGGIYVAFKETKSVGITTVVAAVFNIIIDVFMIRIIGLYAASISTLVSYMILFFYRVVDVKKFIKIDYSVVYMFVVFLIMLTEAVLCFKKTMLFNIINIIVGLVTFVILNKSFIKIIIIKFKSKL